MTASIVSFRKSICFQFEAAFVTNMSVESYDGLVMSYILVTSRAPAARVAARLCTGRDSRVASCSSHDTWSGHTSRVNPL